MITNLDHVVVLVRDLEAGIVGTKTLFGREPSWRTDNEGAATAIFTLTNMSLELMAPSGEGGTGDRIRTTLDKQGKGLASFAFAVDDIARMHRRLKRLGLDPEDIADGASRDVNGSSMSWKRTRASAESTHGIRMFFIQHETIAPAVENQTGIADHHARPKRRMQTRCHRNRVAFLINDREITGIAGMSRGTPA